MYNLYSIMYYNSITDHLSMLGAAAVLGEEQVVGSSSPLLLPSGIFTASLAHSGPVLAL